MATITSGGNGRTDAISTAGTATLKSSGDFNRVTKVASSTTVAFTGSNAAAGFIVENVTNVTIMAVNGGTLPGSTLAADTLYNIAPRKVSIGGTGVVHVLHR
tara:strand:- start:1925 stop:2230 length:306 start_codon:yes stop_codon:yes gene_type:complete